MSTWRDRLCGSTVVTTENQDDPHASMRQQLTQSSQLSCGGGYYPVNLNTANMKTFRGTFMLPTKDYAVLIFKDDGSAIIYTDAARMNTAEESPEEAPSSTS